jgi:hypothetical protein
VEHAELDDLPRDAVDLHQIADADAVASHQHEPSDEPDDEILERDRESRAGESQEGADIIGRPEDHEQDEQDPQHLERDARHHVQRLRAPTVDLHALMHPVRPLRQHDTDEHDGDQCHDVPEDVVDHRAALAGDDGSPRRVVVAELALDVHALIERRQCLRGQGLALRDCANARSMS